MFDGVIICTQGYFDSLGEYSCSLPTGTTVGKHWKRNNGAYIKDAPDDWVICEYVDHPDPKKVGIRYWKPEIQSAAADE